MTDPFEQDEPLYVISVAAKIVGVNCHTLRYYERVGIIKPARTQGGLRLYSRKDIERLRWARTLMDNLGVNVAGVGLLLKLMERVCELEKALAERDSQINRLFQEYAMEGFIKEGKDDTL